MTIMYTHGEFESVKKTHNSKAMRFTSIYTKESPEMPPPNFDT